MPAYRIQLQETRMATDGTDDVALFNVTCQDDGQSWIVPVVLTPLFRLTQMEATLNTEERERMVAGLGARVIANHLKQDQTSEMEAPVIITLDYPGAPDAPELLLPYEDFTIQTGNAVD